MVAALVETYFGFGADQLSIDAGAGESVLGELLQLFLELALASPHQRGQQHHPVCSLPDSS